METPSGSRFLGSKSEFSRSGFSRYPTVKISYSYMQNLKQNTDGHNNMVGRLLQNSTIYICMQQSILIQLQHWLFSFNNYIHSTSTRAIFVQGKYLLNFNAQSYVLRNEYIYSTSTKKYFHSTKHSYSTLQDPGHR